MSDTTDADHDIEISRDQWLRVSWRCDTCRWVGHNIGSEMTARAEHTKIAADIASGKLRPAEETGEEQAR